MYLVGAFCGGLAILVTYLPASGAAAVGLGVLLAMLLAIAWLERAPYEKQQAKTTAAS